MALNVGSRLGHYDVTPLHVPGGAVRDAKSALLVLGLALGLSAIIGLAVLYFDWPAGWLGIGAVVALLLALFSAQEKADHARAVRAIGQAPLTAIKDLIRDSAAHSEANSRCLGSVQGHVVAKETTRLSAPMTRGGPRNSDSLLRWDPDQGEVDDGLSARVILHSHGSLPVEQVLHRTHRRREHLASGCLLRQLDLRHDDRIVCALARELNALTQEFL